MKKANDKPKPKPIRQALAEEWGDAIAEERKRLGLMQAQLAERAHVAQSVISMLERGKYPSLNLDLMLRLARALECEPRDLFGWPRSLLGALEYEHGAAA